MSLKQAAMHLLLTIRLVLYRPTPTQDKFKKRSTRVMSLLGNVVGVGFKSTATNHWQPDYAYLPRGLLVISASELAGTVPEIYYAKPPFLQ